MKRYRQTFEEIISKLSVIQAEWKDDLAESVLEILDSIPEKDSYTAGDLRAVLEQDFDAGLTLKFLEDKTEEAVREVFGIGNYDARCRFIGATGQSDEKADFAIPSKEDARILIEVKAYGATGSKQTDILGDMERIVSKKRHDTTLLFVTDGVTWKARTRDLRKLIALQNEGKITRIYTSQMFPELRDDLLLLRSEHGLDLKA